MIEAPRIGVLDAGERNSIADVAGVTVGHATLADDGVQTGVTVVRPHAGDPYRDPIPAAAVVINGFGKTTGLVQMNELGTLESPLALTNTFAVGEAHYARALRAASADVAQGAVGAGRGMSCFGLKGGIGSASRIARTSGQRFAVGALVLANFGRMPQLTLKGVPVGRMLAREAADERASERGSIIVVLATDAPLDHRQLRRVALRAASGIARTGSNFGHGSGDIAIAFAAPRAGDAKTATESRSQRALPDDALDPLFDAAADATEQSIVHALFAAETVRGYAGHVRHAIAERLPDWRTRLP
jgi:D-aminopeptidase